eukprot:954149-Amphidinium_carterae.1
MGCVAPHGYGRAITTVLDQNRICFSLLQQLYNTSFQETLPALHYFVKFFALYHRQAIANTTDARNKIHDCKTSCTWPQSHNCYG